MDRNGLGEHHGGAGEPVDAYRVTGPCLEHQIEVGDAGGVPTGEDREQSALGGDDAHPAALLAHQHRERFGGHVVGGELRYFRYLDFLGEFHGGDQFGFTVRAAFALALEPFDLGQAQILDCLGLGD
jgi:hypothetical protein